MGKKVKTREQALKCVTEALDAIKGLLPKSSFFDNNTHNDSVQENDTLQYFSGMRVWKLVVKWKLEEELAKHKNRDYALVHAPVGVVEPKNPKRLFKLAAFHGHAEIILHYIHLAKPKHQPLLVHGSGYNHEANPGKLVAAILERFPVMSKTSAKIILQRTYLIESFYSAIAHFGPDLYRWVKRGPNNCRRCLASLIKMKCPADNRALLSVASWGGSKLTRQLLKLGAFVDDAVKEDLDRRFLHWAVLTEEEINERLLKYGIKPGKENITFAYESAREYARKWVNAVQGEPYYRGSYKYFRQRFQKCLPLIQQVEPEAYERLMFLEP